MKVQEVLVENPVLAAMFIIRFLGAKLQYLPKIGRLGHKAIQQVREKSFRGKKLYPTKEQAIALEKQAATIDDITYSLNRGLVNSPKNIKGLELERAKAVKEIRNIMKEVSQVPLK